MSRPQITINKAHRTQGNSLPTSFVQQIGSMLNYGGFVLLPSDTCYSLAALAIAERVRMNVDAILNRNLGPISIAFSSYRQVTRIIEFNNTTAILLERFTPGPITVVCKVKSHFSPDFLLRSIGSDDGTIGVRIPDSLTEREIAANSDYQLMTVAVRDPENGEAVQDFERALQIVTRGIEALPGAHWAAIEGGPFHAKHSTVVRVVEVGSVELLREGDIGFDDITKAIDTLSQWAVTEWT